MGQSADQAQRRSRERRLQIREAACRLVIDQGYDGFTMDDLAAQVGVSRRTLFNHVSSKEEAVLGPFVNDQSTDAHMIEFTGGGPRGELFADLVALVDRILVAVTAEEPSPEHHLLTGQAVAQDVRLQAMVERRFEVITQKWEDSLCTREGWEPGDLRAKALARVLLSLIRLSLEESKRRRDGTPFNLIFHEVLDAARGAGICDRTR